MAIRSPAKCLFAGLLILQMLLAVVVERRVWESDLNDQTESLRNEDSGKVVNVLVGLDRVEVPWIPGIEPGLEPRPSGLAAGTVSLLVLPPSDDTRAPPLR